MDGWMITTAWSALIALKGSAELMCIHVVMQDSPPCRALQIVNCSTNFTHGDHIQCEMQSNRTVTSQMNYAPILCLNLLKL